MEMTTENWISQESITQPHSPQLQLLNMFEGRWKIKGINFASNSQLRDESLQGEDRYSWMEGNYFMVDHWKHVADTSTHQGMSVLGYDPATSTLFTDTFDNLGFRRHYTLTWKNDTWILHGATERATIRFTENADGFVQEWEVHRDGEGWKPLCKMEGSRLKEKSH